MGVIEYQAGPSRGPVDSARHRTVQASYSSAREHRRHGSVESSLFRGDVRPGAGAELARFVVRSPVRWYLTGGLTALGWLVQTAFLANLALKDPLMLPVATAFGSLMLLSWIVALIGLYLMVRSPRPVAVGMFVLPLVLGLVVGAGWFAPRESDWLDWGGTVAFWGTVHGIFLLAGAVFTCVAFFAGLMYLVQMRRLKAKRPSRIRAGAAEPRAVRADQPGGDHGRLPAADLRAVDRHGPEPGGARPGPERHVQLPLDRPQGRQRAGDVAGLRGAAARAVPAGDAGPEHDGADDRGLRVPGVHLGRRRGTAAAHGPRRGHGRAGRVTTP